MTTLQRQFSKAGTLVLALLAFSLCFVSMSRAQQESRAGYRFSFALPEASDRQTPPNGAPYTSQYFLYILSSDTASGYICTGSGFQLPFKSKPDSLTRILLDYDLMLLYDIGKSNKGITIAATGAINCTLHNFAPFAGESTELIPDHLLGTDYMISGWGLFDDRFPNFDTSIPPSFENNRTEFVVTAPYDGTEVTITPSVNASPNLIKDQPFTFTLNKGECFIVKADSSDRPTITSLSRTRIRSTRPVSVIEGVTCGYVPLGKESCNLMLSAVYPTPNWDKEFYALLPGGSSGIAKVVITSDVDNLNAAIGGTLATRTSPGRIEDVITGPTHIVTDAPAQVQVLSLGSESGGGNTDPSMIAILPRSKWSDSLVWIAPGPFFYKGDKYDFTHYICVVFDTASTDKLFMDGKLYVLGGKPVRIPKTPYSAMVDTVTTGIHKLYCNTPIFAIASGYQDADAFTYLPTKLLQASQVADTLPGPVAKDYTLDPDKTDVCTDVRIALTTTTPILESEDIVDVDITLNYPSSLLKIMSITPGALLPATANFQAFEGPIGDTQIVITSQVRLNGTGELAVINARGIADGAGLISAIAHFTSCSRTVTSNPISVLPLTVAIGTKADGAVSASVTHSTLGNIDTITVMFDGVPPGSEIRDLDIGIDYDHDLLSPIRYDFTQSVVAGWDTVTTTSQTQDRIKLHSASATLDNKGLLFRLIVQSYVSDLTSTPVHVTSNLKSSRDCPLTVTVPDVSTLFLGKLLCGDKLLMQVLSQKQVALESVHPNPSQGTFHIELSSPHHVDNVRLSVSNILGKEIWSTPPQSVGAGKYAIDCTLPSSLPSGKYILRLESPEGIGSREISVTK